MSLYFGVFDGDGELNGWVFGHYSDFGFFRDEIKRQLNVDDYPLLLGVSDCDGVWNVEDFPELRKELLKLTVAMKLFPPMEFANAFEHTRTFRRNAKTLYDCFHNVDGENVIEALLTLCDFADKVGKPIRFQ